MDSGFYAAVNGALRTEMRLEVLTNNLSNVNTNGYKADDITFDSFLTSTGPEQFPLPTDSFLGLRGPGDIPFPYSNMASNAYQMTYPMATGTVTDMSQGSLKPTGNPLDMAIEGEGFFVVETEGGPRYTRDGSFSVNQEGELVNKNGLRVLGQGNAPMLVGNGQMELGPDGTIVTAEGAIGQLARVQIPEEVMRKEGSNLYSAPEDMVNPSEPGEANVYQGFVEGSNSNTIRGMTQMVESNRAFEVYMKMIRSLDGLDNQAVNQIGKLNG